jgi:predicted dehydrogenase
MSETTKTVRWGVMGTARIATKVGKAIHQADGAELAAIASRNSERAGDWAAEHGAGRSYGNYESLLDDDELDALYIPLPPSMHLEWVVRAAERGKHVLCEKPLAMNAAEAAEMAAACREHGVQLMDGVMWLHHPRTAVMRQAVRDGKLGQLRRVTSAFSFHWDEVPMQDIRMQRELGGGCLGDLGWYCAGATLWAMGGMPERVCATARYLNDVDINFSAVLWYDNDRTASFDCAFDTTWRKWFELAGTHGSLVCDDFVNPWKIDKPRFWLHDADGRPTEHVCEPLIQEVCMIEDFCKLVRSGDLDFRWPNTAVATQRVCDALDEAARSGSVVELEGPA